LEYGGIKVKQAAQIILWTLMFVAVAVAQQPPQPQGTQVVTPKAPYDSDKAQLAVKQETILQLTATADQKSFQDHMKDLQTQYQAEEQTLNVWIAKVRSDNGWDDTYNYDRAKDQWVHTPKVEAKKPEAPKPAEAPKK
jgi:hypothetical protein